LAISKGAALIASGEYVSEHLCTHSYGYVRYKLNEAGGVSPYIPVYIPVIKKGTNIKELDKPVFAKDKETVSSNKKDKLKIFRDDGRPDNAGRKEYALDASVKELFSNVDADDQDKWYQIGFSVNKNEIPTIHTKDRNGLVKSTSLNNLFEKIGR